MIEKFLIVSLLVSFLSPSCSSLQVLVFSTEKSDNLTTSTARFISPPPTNFSDVSFCFWIKLNNLRGTKVLHYDLNDSHGLGFTLQEHYGFIKLKNIDLLFDYLTPALPRRWRHFCTTYSAERQSVAVYLDGRVTFSREGLEVVEDTEFQPSLLTHLSWGDGKERFGQPVSGELSVGRVWSRVLGEEEVVEEAGCREVDREGLQVDWQVGGLERGESVLAVEREGDCPLYLDEGEERLVGFSDRVSFMEAGVACMGLGGRQVRSVVEESDRCVGEPR